MVQHIRTCSFGHFQEQTLQLDWVTIQEAITTIVEPLVQSGGQAAIDELVFRAGVMGKTATRWGDLRRLSDYIKHAVFVGDAIAPGVGPRLRRHCPQRHGMWSRLLPATAKPKLPG
jgi:hypothetical protein